MNERYTECEAPPRLQDMNAYRDDGKDALKFYTDPTYFFELWREEMKKEQDRKKKKKVEFLFIVYHKAKHVQVIAFINYTIL